MSFILYFVSLVFIVLGPLSSLAVPPADWATTLEPYDIYHHRYIILHCHEKHATHFFDQCCRPFLMSESHSKRISHCVPPTAAPIAAGETSDDCEQVDHLSPRDEDVHVPSQPLISTTLAPLAWSTSAHTSRLTSMRKHSQILASKQTAKHTSQVNAGGYATYFYQNGNAGACGRVHSDKDLIAAIDARRYGFLGGRSSLCGRKVKIINQSNSKSVVVTIADACPTCHNGNSIDLSLGAFKIIADLSQGIVSINWLFIS